MSLKAVEMQIALPRTLDAGKIQEQLQQRGQVQQSIATDSTKKEELKKQTTVIKQERKDITRFQKEKHQQEESEQQEKKQHQQHPQVEQHPYKGTKVDYSG